MLSDKLTNPDLINPLIQNQHNTPTQNNTSHAFSVFEGETEPQPANNGEGRGNWRNRKLDLPVFYGEDPDGWILQAERYFTFYSLNEKEKVEAAIVSLEGAALQWFHWEHQRRPIKLWEELKGLVLRRFRLDGEGTLHEQWMMVKQTHSVAEYNLEFVEKANPLGEIPEKILMGTYLKGLEEGVRRELRLFEPVNLDHAMSLAVKIDFKQNPRPTNYQNTLKCPSPFNRHVSHPRPPSLHLSLPQKIHLNCSNPRNNHIIPRAPKLNIRSRIPRTHNIPSTYPSLPLHTR